MPHVGGLRGIAVSFLTMVRQLRDAAHASGGCLAILPVIPDVR